MNFYAAVTMVYKSYHFLEKWVDYYGGQFGKSNLFIISHGGDSRHDEICAGCNLVRVPRKFEVDFDEMRWHFLSNFTSGLLSFYAKVLCVDCDEFVVVDPGVAPDLPSYFAKSALRARVVPTSPVGFQVVPSLEQLEQGGRVDWGRPLTEQFHRIYPDTQYAKPCIIARDVTFLPGGHGVKQSPLILDRNLVLLHIKYLDEKRVQEMAKDLSRDIRVAKRKTPQAKALSSLWQFGPMAESKFLHRVCSAEEKIVANPIRFAYMLTIDRLSRSKDETSSFLPIQPYGRVPLLSLPERFWGIL